jgi:hypothetical protein
MTKTVEAFKSMSFCYLGFVFCDLPYFNAHYFSTTTLHDQFQIFLSLKAMEEPAISLCN